MGSRRSPALSESAMCAAYRRGVSRYDICLAARIYDRELVEVLRRNGIALRTDAEWKALAAASQAAHRERQRAKRAAC